MLTKIRILVVDDSSVVRKVVSEMLGGDPSLEVVSTAPNGRIALDKIGAMPIDVVVLDLEMPELDGLSTLKEIRKRSPSLPVIVFSSLTERAGTMTLDALAMGASDYVTKPSGLGAAAIGREDVRRQLVEKCKALGHRARAEGSHGPHPVAAPTPPPAAKAIAPATSFPPPELVVIGASTGGPNLVADILASLPGDFPVPVAVVQHMPPLFTRLFSERLRASCQIEVREGESGILLRPGFAVIAPGDFHLEVLRTPEGLAVRTNQGLPENSCRPAVDVLFRSAAVACGSAVLGIVLTGMGHDGLAGCQILRAVGAQVIVQDQETSVVGSMPGSVARAGLALAEIPDREIAAEILRRVGTAVRSGGVA